MGSALRLLLLEDNPSDAELMLAELRAADFVPEWRRVETEADFLAALDPTPDLVLADYSLPSFTGIRALELCNARGLDIPFILVSGTMGEDTAVQAMKNGAADYLLKDRLSRLGEAVHHVLEAKRLRDSQRQAEEVLLARERRFRAIIEHSHDVIVLFNADGTVHYASPSTTRLLGYLPEEIYGRNMLEFVRPDYLDALSERFADSLHRPGVGIPAEGYIRHKDGEWRYLEGTLTNLLHEPSVNAIVNNYHDITERKRAEEKIQRQIEYLNALRTIDDAIGSSFDLHLVLDVVLKQVISELGVDASAVLLLKATTQTIEYAGSRGFRSNALHHTQLKLSEGYAGRAVIERKTIHISDLMRTGGKLAEALQLANEGFAEYYGTPLIVKGEVKGVLEIYLRTPLKPDKAWLDFMETLAGQAAIAIDNAQLFESLQSANLQLSLAYDTTIEGWSRALDLRDKETEGHSQRVMEMTLQLARAIGMSEAGLVQVRRGALLHDIGKMGVSDVILLKPGKLTDEEWIIMRQHPTLAYELLTPIAYLRPALDIPHYHHEKWDGTGYPHGLKGEQIPQAARLFAVVDVWDALTSDRPYRAAWSKEQALDHIRSLAGTHFDPQAVDLFFQVMGKNAHEHKPGAGYADR